MKALIAASSREELSSFKDERYVKVVTGVGLSLAAVNTVKAIIEFDPDIVINIGSAGSLKSCHPVGSVLSFSSVYCKDQNLSLYHLAPYATIMSDGSTVREMKLIGDENILLSSSSFSSEKDDVVNADAADMECYSVALASYLCQKRCASFKLITDIVGERPLISDYKRILREGRIHLEEEVRRFLANIR